MTKSEWQLILLWEASKLISKIPSIYIYISVGVWHLMKFCLVCKCNALLLWSTSVDNMTVYKGSSIKECATFGL